MVLDKLHRAKGAMMGLAVGDALGTTLEFTQPGTFTPITDIVGGGPFRLKPGEWTDDTSMALCLAESLMERQTFDPIDQLQRYTRWWREGHLSSNGRCFDIGNATRAALSRFMKTGEAFCGSTDPQSAGNGSLMRLAPVALFYASQPSEAIRRAAESSRTTHAADECVDACRYMAGLLVGTLAGESKERLLADSYGPPRAPGMKRHLRRELRRLRRGLFAENSRRKYRDPVMLCVRWRPLFGHFIARTALSRPS